MTCLAFNHWLLNFKQLLLLRKALANMGADTTTGTLTLPALSIAGELWVAELCGHASQPAGEGLQQRRTAGAVKPHAQGVPAAGKPDSMWQPDQDPALPFPCCASCGSTLPRSMSIQNVDVAATKQVPYGRGCRV